MDPSMLAAAAMAARQRIVKNQGEEVVTTSTKEGGSRSSFQNAPSHNFAVPRTAKPEKPPDWKPPNKKYGGAVPKIAEGPGPAPVRPDLSSIGEAIVSKVKTRKERISDPNYQMKVRESCTLPCCQYLKAHQDEQQLQQKVIIKKVIRRRRPKQEPAAQEQAPGGMPPPLIQQSPPQLVTGPTLEQQQAAEAARRQQEQQQRQIAEAERKRKEEEDHRRQAAEEQWRQQQAAAEEQRRQQQAAAEEAERQRQASMAAAAAVPTQKVAIFQNLGTDPAMAHAELYYESTRWGPLGHGDPPVSVGTFPGHRWFIVANGCYAKLFTVGEDAQQIFTF